jgi:2-hydroxychromene-2-carboxylate isomerase
VWISRIAGPPWQRGLTIHPDASPPHDALEKNLKTGDRLPMRFYFDYVSPYAYLAWTQIHALASRHGRDVEPVPVLLAGLLGAHGTVGPAEVPAKRRYLFRDIVRTGRRLGVPIAPPHAHPFNPLLALRVSSLPMPAGQQRALIDALYAATWSEGADVTDPARVARIARSVGLDGDAAIALASTPDAKERVRQRTDEAIAAGAFGVPSLVADGELFWGHDSLANLEAFLRGEGGIDDALGARWEAIPVAATRKLPPK